MKRFILLILLLSYMFVSGCAGLMERPEVVQEELIAQELYKGGYYHSPVSISVNNKIATLYLTEKGRVAFKMGDNVLFLDEDLDVKEQGYGRKPSLYQEGSRLYRCIDQKRVRRESNRYQGPIACALCTGRSAGSCRRSRRCGSGCCRSACRWCARTCRSSRPRRRLYQAQFRQ